MALATCPLLNVAATSKEVTMAALRYSRGGALPQLRCALVRRGTPSLRYATSGGGRDRRGCCRASSGTRESDGHTKLAFLQLRTSRRSAGTAGLARDKPHLFREEHS